MSTKRGTTLPRAMVRKGSVRLQTRQRGVVILVLWIKPEDLPASFFLNDLPISCAGALHWLPASLQAQLPTISGEGRCFHFGRRRDHHFRVVGRNERGLANL